MEEEIFFSGIIGPSREIVSAIRRNVNNAEGFMHTLVVKCIIYSNLQSQEDFIHNQEYHFETRESLSEIDLGLLQLAFATMPKVS